MHMKFLEFRSLPTYCHYVVFTKCIKIYEIHGDNQNMIVV